MKGSKNYCKRLYMKFFIGLFLLMCELNILFAQTTVITFPHANGSSYPRTQKCWLEGELALKKVISTVSDFRKETYK